MRERLNGESVDHDYSGPFDPDWSLERLSRPALARLGRETMLVSMYHDRGLMPHIAVAHGQDATIRHADAEWMAASPVYTERNKHNLGIEGDGVAEVFKSLQFDIGAPHHFLDFHFEVVDHDLGYFWLPFCGAHDYLRQISHNDPVLVTNMCHHMEDRTFDATLGATNPKARASPLHRPPKPDAMTGDHCRWEVRIIDDEPGPRAGEPAEATLRASKAAGFVFPSSEPAEPGGHTDYSGDFLPELRLEEFSHPMLVRQVKEFALDVHLLVRASYLSVDENFSPELLDDVAPQHRAAMAPAVVTRLRSALGIEGDGIDVVAKMVQLDPFLIDDYVDYRVEIFDDRHARVEFADCSGLTDDICRSPLSWLGSDWPGFETIARAVNPRASAHLVESEALLAYDIVIDPEAEPVEPHWAAEMTSGGGILDFDLRERPVTIRS